MFDLGIQELVVIFIVALLVFGPKRLPDLGRTIGKTVGQFRSAISGIKNEVEKEIHTADTAVDIKELPAWKKKDEERSTEVDLEEGEESLVHKPPEEPDDKNA